MSDYLLRNLFCILNKHFSDILDISTLKKYVSSTDGMKFKYIMISFKLKKDEDLIIVYEDERSTFISVHKNNYSINIYDHPNNMIQSIHKCIQA